MHIHLIFALLFIAMSPSVSLKVPPEWKVYLDQVVKDFLRLAMYVVYL